MTITGACVSAGVLGCVGVVGLDEPPPPQALSAKIELVANNIFFIHFLGYLSKEPTNVSAFIKIMLL
jgi:hypothetical protein